MTEILSGFVKDAFPELFVEGQVVSAEQNFHRRLAEYEMNIEQQKLFREDLRDLVELTVGRMDVYHLVGALLLEFCIHFYCENAMLEEAETSQSKAFLVVFFLISNLSACGFLIFSVWLSMHASVASHSIGVRLLTSFARLSIPTRKELEEVAKAPLVPMVERFRQLGKRLGLQSQAAVAAGAQTAEVREAAEAAAVALRQETTDLARAAAGLSSMSADLAIQEGAKALSDREYHFRRFLKEQRRWLFYDAYARVCMALGMNQLLCALSYYIVGAIAEETPSGAALSLLGMQCLALLLLRLDVSEGVQQWGGVIAVLICMSLPPIYMGVLIHFVEPTSVRTVTFLALPAFLLHSMWMLLIAAYLVPGSMDEGLPKQLRTVLYLDVLHLDQQEMADEIAAQHEKDSLAGLREAKMTLQQAMRAILEEEASTGSASASRRTAPELLELEACLRAEVAEARVLDLTAPSSSTRYQIRDAEKTLEHFTVWRAAPEMNANLAALSSPKVADWLSAQQREEIEKAYQSFLARCKELDLGIGYSGPSPDAGPPQNAEGGAQEPRLNALEVASGEERRVRVEAPVELMGAMGGYQPQSVYIDSDGRINHEASAAVRTTSFNCTVSTDLPQWNESALRLMRQDTEQEECQFVERNASPRRRRAPPHRSLTRRQRLMSTASLARTNSGQPYAAADAARETAHRIVEAGSSLMPASAVPPHALPGVIVRRFAFLLAFLWLASGVTHCLRWTGSGLAPGDEPPQLLGAAPLAAYWPPPAHLFEVDAIHCQGSSLLLRNRFGLFAGRLPGLGGPQGLAMEEVQGLAEDGEAATSTACSASGPCSLLVKQNLQGQERRGWADYSLQKLTPGQPENEPAKVRLPSSWRRMAVHQLANASAGGDQLHVVGWDGSEVFFATVRQGNEQAKPRFVLRPERACRSSLARWPKASALMAWRCAGGPENYTDVQALEFAAGGSLLLVLHGGFLDAWRPAAGRWVGRWRLHKPGASLAASVCIQEQPRRRLIAAWRMPRSPPVLETLELPRSLEPGCESQEQAVLGDIEKLII